MRRIDLELTRIYWYRWSSEPADVLLVAGQNAGSNVIYRVDAESGQVALLAGTVERTVQSFATHLNNFGFTYDRFKNAESNTLSDLSRDGKLTPVGDINNSIPAFLDVVDGYLGLRFERGRLRVIFGKQREEIQITGPEQRQGAALVSVTSAGMAYLLSSSGTDTLGLLELDLRTGAKRVLVQEDVDIQRVILNPIDMQPDAVETERSKPKFVVVNARIRPDINRLMAKGWGFPRILDRSPNDKYWIVKYGAKAKAPIWAVYDRSKGNIEAVQLASQISVANAEWDVKDFNIRRTDGPDLNGYVTMPSRELCKGKPCPLILKLHGGPAQRDFTDMDQERFWLVSRGMAVATINYRGSRGFGKRFEAQDQKQWASGIPEDVRQGLDYVLDNFGVDRSRIGVIGTSFSGYLALNLAANSDAVKCAIIDSATTDMVKFVEASVAVHGDRSDLLRRVGDPRLPADRNKLASMSPLVHVDRLKQVQLLQFHGERDSITVPENNQEFVEKMLKKNSGFTYVVFPSQGHGLLGVRQEYAALSEQFLAKCLNTVAEPLTTDERKRLSDAVVRGRKEFF